MKPFVAIAQVFAGMLALSACQGDNDTLAPEDDPAGSLDDLKLDSFYEPTEMGDIAENAPEDERSHAEIKSGERYHLWTFSILQHQDTFRLWTEAYDGDINTNTVVYLYKRQDDGTWGTYLAKNDDGIELPFEEGGEPISHAPFSLIEMGLDAGEYGVLVKGKYRQSRGEYAISYDCSGGRNCR